MEKKSVRRAGGSAIVAVLAVLSFSTAATASLVDWNVKPGGSAFNTSISQYANWVPGAGANPNNAAAASYGSSSGIDWVIWDGYGPHGNASAGVAHNTQDFGGMRYDVKAMYRRADSANLYVGIVTSFDPSGYAIGPWGGSVESGDLAINPDLAGNSAEYAVLHKDWKAGATGWTTLMHGGTWYTPAAQFAPPPNTNYQSGGTVAGTDIHVAYSDTGVTYYDAGSKSYIPVYLFEYTIPLARIGGQTSPALMFGPGCQNDYLTLSGQSVAGQIPIPEPEGMVMIGVAAIALVRRRSEPRA